MNRVALVILITSLIGAAIGACTTVSTAVGPRVASAVARYCREPLSERLVIREQVRTLAAPNSIQVNCAGDPPPTP